MAFCKFFSSMCPRRTFPDLGSTDNLAAGNTYCQHHARAAAEFFSAVGCQLSLPHSLTKEEQRMKSLVLRRRRHVALCRQMIQKGGDLLLAHFLGMPFVVKEDKPPNPIDISRFGANRLAFQAQMPPHPLQQFEL